MAPIGYLNAADPNDPEGRQRTVVVDPVRAPLVKTALELYNTGEYSIISLLAEMTKRGLRTKATSRKPSAVLTKHAVERMLKNTFYYGEFQWSGQIWKGKHAPIISQALFESVQGKLRRKLDSAKSKAKRPAAFRGLFRCGYCGSMLTSESHKNITYYRCTYNKPYKGKCPQRFFREDVLDKMIEAEIGNLPVDKALIGLIRRELAKDHLDQSALEKREMQRLETRKAKVQNIFQVALELKADGKLTDEEFDSEIQRWRNEKTALETAMEGLLTVITQFAKETVNLLKLMSGFKKAYHGNRWRRKQRSSRFLKGRPHKGRGALHKLERALQLPARDKQGFSKKGRVGCQPVGHPMQYLRHPASSQFEPECNLDADQA